MARALALGAPEGTRLWAAPGTFGTAPFATSTGTASDDIAGIVELARSHEVDAVVVGPEKPLALGLSDALAKAGIPCVGPSAAAARIESSKVFARELAARAGVPGPAFTVIHSMAQFEAALDDYSAAPVVKADGLAQGKGVVVPQTKAEARVAARAFLKGDAGLASSGPVVLEERLSGVEASAFFACAGEDVVALGHARDFKRAFDGDAGPNTGGMGAVSPSPTLKSRDMALVEASFVRPVLHALKQAGCPFQGFLYVGLMATANGLRLVEYNARLGDPETQALLPRMKPGDFLKVCLGIARGRLGRVDISLNDVATCAVVLAAPGYPEKTVTGQRFAVPKDDVERAFHYDAAAVRHVDSMLETSGGRVLAVVGRGLDALAASAAAYSGLSQLNAPALHHRKDIA